jgi:hypothetical protein
MKNKIAIASAFIAASSFSFAEIALTESFSVKVSSIHPTPTIAAPVQSTTQTSM